MITSMTAFARQAYENLFGTLVWEIRTVNHRYFEVNFRIPDMFRAQEMAFREIIAQKIKRGKIEVNGKYLPGAKLPYEFKLNRSILDQLLQVSQTIKLQFQEAQLNIMDVLAFNGVMQSADANQAEFESYALQSFESAVSQLIKTREREGEKLSEYMNERLTKIREQIILVEKRLPLVLQAQQDRIKARFAACEVELDPVRLEQELVFLAQKTDVAEELSRLKLHVDEVQRVLKEESVAGRRLDFLMQELNREANTLSSKSIDADHTQSAVELKVLIEQMREQVQNIE